MAWATVGGTRLPGAGATPPRSGPAEGARDPFLRRRRQRIALEARALLEGVREDGAQRLEGAGLAARIAAWRSAGATAGSSSASRARQAGSQASKAAGSAKRARAEAGSSVAASARRRKARVKSTPPAFIASSRPWISAASPSRSVVRPSLRRRPPSQAAWKAGAKAPRASCAQATARSCSSSSSGSSASARRARFHCMMRGWLP
jgi:hypothetical protein